MLKEHIMIRIQVGKQRCSQSSPCIQREVQFLAWMLKEHIMMRVQVGIQRCGRGSPASKKKCSF
jgi:hypothetical protein